MKYSLKNEYKHLIYEEPVRVITQDDVLTNNKVTRIYDLVAPNKYDPSEIITLEPREIIYHSEIDSFLNKVNITGSKNNFNRKKITLSHDNKKESISSNIPKIIFNSIFDTIENNVIRGFFNVNDSDNSYFDTLEKFRVSMISDSDAEFLINSVNENIEKIMVDDKFSDLSFLKDVDLTGLKNDINIRGQFKISIFNPNFVSECKKLIVSITTNRLESSRLKIAKNILSEFSRELLKNAASTSTRAGIEALEVLRTQLIPNLNKESQESKINNLIDMITRYYTDSTLFDIKSKGILERIASEQLNIRVTPNNVYGMLNILNDEKVKEITNFAYNTKNRIGPGEFGVHLLLNTQNVCSSIEPDAVVQTKSEILRCSIKSTAGARTGEKMSIKLRKNLEEFFLSFFKKENQNDVIANIVKLCSNINYEFFSYLIYSISNEGVNFSPSRSPRASKINIYKKDFDKDYFLTAQEIKSNEIKIRSMLFLIKKEMLSEHDASHVITYNNLENKYDIIDLKSRQDIENVHIQAIAGNRVNFVFDYKTDFEKAFDKIFTLPGIKQESIKRKNKLEEIYPRLFKKKIINEGGLAGHMMHPYEALDMTPRQIVDRIKEYSTSQKIVEKVDGQNLFFTVEQDGTLMFARNKADMTHNDLVEKFTNHPAEVPFVTGGNAIKKGVDQWLSSAGAFGQQEILDIFHPDGEARSFINFEIMHKDHPNQLEYGENFIVFHSIVDFIDGREAVYSSNNSQRLDKLISLIRPGIESSDYTLASNRTVNLNKLTNVQILSYIKRVNEIANQLEITDFEFLGDGVEKQIKKQLDTEGVNISDEAIKILYDFALYGEDRSGNKIKSKDFTSLMQSEDVKKLRAIDLTNANKAAAKVRRILSPFKEVFVDLGIDLLDGVPSAYMDSETNLENIDKLRDKLETAIGDLRLYMRNTPESNWDAEVNRLKEYYDKIEEVGIHNAVSTSVEGGVYDYQGDLLKVTGGFAPLNQILGAAYRDKKGIFPSFKEKFIQQELNRRSLKSVFNLIF